jgi:hypothetical protein
MNIGLHSRQPAPSFIVHQRSRQPDKQADRHSKTGEYGQAAEHILHDLNGWVAISARIPTIANVERRIARNLRVLVQKAHQRRIRLKIGLVA